PRSLLLLWSTDILSVLTETLIFGLCTVVLTLLAEHETPFCITNKTLFHLKRKAVILAGRGFKIA
ncbi:MAG: hypothetical protein ACRDCA_25160, partial [Serratia sp. (in: enterobacteria)]|uniref:hypothetical protein n=1 Tax=Serratia sp. (in: enterobacteria) TaxID=616 RepID=UPI003F2D5BC7